MKSSDLKLPSNKKFGFFFGLIFFLGGFFFFYEKSNIIALVLCSLALLFIFTALLNDKLLLPLNKMWMRFGLIIGIIISPIVMGLIFFGIITPYGLLMRIFGRDELKLKKIKKRSFWIIREEKSPQTDFMKQF